MSHDHDAHDEGLAFDLPGLLGRRQMLGALGGVALVGLAGCGSSEDAALTSAPSATATPSAATTSAATCTEIPTETGGPFPGDGSNGPNVLAQSGVVRQDIRKSFGSSTGTAAGVPLLVELTVVDTKQGCAPRQGAAVYLWQCDRDGKYSMYSDGVTNQNYLRGVQEADASGKLSFQSIFPGCYQGRWPHLHFEVYPSLADATKVTGKLKTSQIALPEADCKAVYATDGYASSIRTFAAVSLDRDGIFRDGYSSQLATMTGTPATGYTARLTVAV